MGRWQCRRAAPVDAAVGRAAERQGGSNRESPDRSAATDSYPTGSPNQSDVLVTDPGHREPLLNARDGPTMGREVTMYRPAHGRRALRAEVRQELRSLGASKHDVARRLEAAGVRGRPGK